MTAVTARGLFDYRHMFALDESPLATTGSILDCPGGASPFGAQVRSRGGTVTSVDALYTKTPQQILDRVHANLSHARDWLTEHQNSIDWDYLGSVDAHLRASEVAADLFATDYANHPEHYVPATLPRLPFPDQHFELTLSANLLFVYADQLSPDDHIAALRELVRVTRGEVRVHPIGDITTTPHPHLDDIRAALAEHDITTELRPIAKAWIAGSRHTLICYPTDQSREARPLP